MGEESQYGELVFGIVTTIGANKSSLVRDLEDSLRRFGYEVKVFKVSKEIIDQFYNSSEVNRKEDIRLQHYMDKGNLIRKKANDNSILIRGIISKIYNQRNSDSSGSKEPGKKKAFIIDSIKHPDEVKRLRVVYKDAFFLIGFTSDYDSRKRYLIEQKSVDDSKADEILKRDECEDDLYGQHVRDAFQLADFFITDINQDSFRRNSINRFIDLIFGSPYLTPTFEEYAMYMAFATSLRTADLSRQIGAVIAKNNEVLATGTNDCPRSGGGLYWPIRDEQGSFFDEEGGRDYKNSFDPNKNVQAEIIKLILKNLDLPFTDENVRKIADSGIGDLTEFGRVVHGEMEAIMFCARNNISCRGADMYVTTFPCHNCAKHIIAAGIKRVVYIEPYPKSRAFNLFSNEITAKKNNIQKDKVLFKMFEGVGPQRYQDLFSMNSLKLYKRVRKDSSGKTIDWKREDALPRCLVPLFNYIDVEKMEVSYFVKKKEEITNQSNHN